MLGQSISLALLSTLGLVSSLPTEKRQELGEGIPPKRSIAVPAGVVFEECSSIDLGGVQTAFDILVETYGSSPDVVTFAALQPVYDILRGCGVDVLVKRDVLAVPTEASPVDMSALQEVYTQLEAASPEPASLTEFIAMDVIAATIEMNSGSVAKRWEKRAASVTCSTDRINAWRLGLFTIAASYGDDVPVTIWLIAQNLVAMLNSCGVSISMEDIFGLGTPVVGGLEPDPTIPGGPMVPDNPAEGGAIEPDDPVEGGGMEPDPIYTATLSPGSVETATAEKNRAKRDDKFAVYPGTTTGMVPDKTIPGGGMIPDPVIPGGPMKPDPIYTPPKAKRQFSIGTPITGGLNPDPVIPGGKMRPDPIWSPPKEKRQFGIGAPIIVGGLVPDNPSSPPLEFPPKAKRDFVIGQPIPGGEMTPDPTITGGAMTPDPVVPGGSMIPGRRSIEARDVKCNKPLYEAMVTLETTYGRACDGKLSPSILMAQQALVVIIFRECGAVWPEWQLVELNGGFIEIGPIYSTGPVISD